MSSTDSSELNNMLQQCMEDPPDTTNENSLAEDTALIMKAMGITACKTSSASGCMSSQAGFGFAGSSFCAGAEAAIGCEQLLANFSKTLTVRDSLVCAIEKKIQETTTSTIQSNTININLSGAKCCTCGTNCMNITNNGKITNYSCSAIGDLSQTNVADISSTTEFSVEESEQISREVLTAVVEDINMAADSKKEGVGADVGQKIIGVNEFENIMNDEELSLSINVQKSLNQLSQENIANLNLSGLESAGPCINDITQTNIVKMVVNNVMGMVMSSIKSSVDTVQYDKILEAVASKETVGTDITAAATPPMGGIVAIIGFVIVAGIAAFVFMSIKKGGGGFAGMIGAGGRALPPKVRMIYYSVIVILVGLFVWWIIHTIRSF